MKQPIVYYISQGPTAEQHLAHLIKMANAGCSWVQLRLKNTPKKQHLQIALRAQEYCKDQQVNLIINDNVEIAKVVDAAGVHLGKHDQDPLIARKVLGKDKIIGGTANTWEDCKILLEKKVDYIGLGPFRFTATKKNLSPILGINSYHTIIQKMQHHPNRVPIVAIGGITLADISALQKAGVWGIALSAYLHQQSNIPQAIKDIKDTFKSSQLYEY